MLGAGDCFLLETNRDRDGTIISHLFVIVINPEEFTKNTIVVPVDTLTSRKQDQTTTLNLGDHEFIKKPSFINYNRARIMTVTFIDQMIRDGKAKSKEPIKTEVLIKIRDGLRKSDHTPQEVLTMYGYYIMREIKK